MHLFVCVYSKFCTVHISNVYNIHHQEIYILLYMQLFVYTLLTVTSCSAEQLVTVSMICTNSCMYCDM